MCYICVCMPNKSNTWACKKRQQNRVINMAGKSKNWYQVATKYIRMMNQLKQLDIEHELISTCGQVN